VATIADAALKLNIDINVRETANANITKVVESYGKTPKQPKRTEMTIINECLSLKKKVVDSK